MLFCQETKKLHTKNPQKNCTQKIPKKNSVTWVEEGSVPSKIWHTPGPADIHPQGRGTLETPRLARPQTPKRLERTPYRY